MVLHNVTLLPSGKKVDIGFTGSTITSLSNTNQLRVHNPVHLTFENALAFPGLINSHDHLDFNLFPALGDPPYKNYVEWGNSIHGLYKDKIDSVLKIPLGLRVKWGIYKNLLCGVTTVIDHGPKFNIDLPLIEVISNHQSLHSVGFEKYWQLKLNNPFKKNMACVIHVGEGTDKRSEDEINGLIKWNLFKRPLIAIHGVAMNRLQAQEFRAIIWCPASNNFLFDATARIDQLKLKTAICFGTDSTLTSNWNIWEHIRLAKKTGFVSTEELFDMLTEIPATVWGLERKCISEGKRADIVISRMARNEVGMDAFVSTNPEDLLLVIQKGNIRLFDGSLLHQLTSMGFSPIGYTQIRINGEQKFVEGDIKGLVSEVKKHNPLVTFPFELLD